MSKGLRSWRASVAAGASSLTLLVAAQFMGADEAAAACSLAGSVITCADPGQETTSQGNGDDGITINLSGADGISVAGDSAIWLGNFGIVNADNGTPIETVGGSLSVIEVGDDGVINIGTVKGTGDLVGGVFAGDRLTLVLRQGGTLETSGFLAPGISAFRDSDVTVGGLIRTDSGTLPCGCGPSPFPGSDSPAIFAQFGSTVTVSPTGTLETLGDDSAGILAIGGGERNLIAMNGTIRTSGSFSPGISVIDILGGPLPPGTPPSSITVGQTGRIETTGILSDGIALGNFVFPFLPPDPAMPLPSIGSVLVDGTVHAAGDEAVGISVGLPNLFLGPFPPGPELARATATITVGATGTVRSDTAEAILEISDPILPIDTTLRIAGTVVGNLPSFDPSVPPLAVYLGSGDDTLILEPGFVVQGAVDAGLDGQIGGDTFALGGAGTGTFDATLLDGDGVFDPGEQFGGFETFEKREASVFTLTGTSTEIALFSVRGGGLFVNGVLAGTSFPVSAGATLGGVGTIGSFTTEAGSRIAPGTPGSFGTLRVSGDAAFAPGSIFEVALNDAGSTDLLIVGGTTTIGGGTIEVVATPGAFTQLRTYTVVDSPGGVTGTFAGVTDNLPDVDFDDIYDATTVKLGFTRQAAGPAPESDKHNAQASLFGVGVTALNFAELLANRMGTGGPGVGGGTTEAIPALGYAELGHVEHLPPFSALHGADPVRRVEPGGFGLWIAGFGDDTSVDAAGGVAGYDSDAAGIAAGAEYVHFGAGRSVFGVGGGYSRSSVDVVNGGADIDAGHVGLYAGHQRGALSVTGALAYSFGDYELARRIAFGGGSVIASADTDGTALSGYAQAFYDLAPALGLSGVTLGPVARLRGVSVDRDGYVETGAGILNLAVGDDSTSQIHGDVGIRAAILTTAGDVVLRPEIELRYERSFSDAVDVSYSAIPLAGASFATPVHAGARDRFGVGLGVSADLSGRLSGSLRYDGSFGDGVSSNRGSLDFTLKF